MNQVTHQIVVAFRNRTLHLQIPLRHVFLSALVQGCSMNQHEQSKLLALPSHMHTSHTRAGIYMFMMAIKSPPPLSESDESRPARRSFLAQILLEFNAMSLNTYCNPVQSMAITHVQMLVPPMHVFQIAGFLSKCTTYVQSTWL